MADYSRHPSGSNNGNHPHHHHHEDDGCEPIDDPADQPEEPRCECEPLPTTHPPKLEEPEKCPQPCCCPTPPVPPGPNCLDDLIRHQTKEISEAQHAAEVKDALQAVLDKATVAQKDYTDNKYRELLKAWKQIDCDIAELVRRLECNIPCWYCLIECHICPLLYAVRYRKKKLYDEWKQYDTAHSLYDLQYWYAGDVRRKQHVFDRIQNVLHAWESPVATIAQVIADNRQLVDHPPNQSSPDYGKFVYDVFLTMIPKHLAIAPPAATRHITRISKHYTRFCDCDTGGDDDCCGPNLGEPTLREQLIGPLPYLVRPEQLLPIICCIAKERYLPASAALARANAHKAKVDAEVQQYEAEIVSKMKSLPDDAKAALPWPIDCEKYEKYEIKRDVSDRPERPGREAPVTR
jgi:hypothetical protein